MDSDFNFNLTPPRFERASDFAQIIKYCWIECYHEVGGVAFTRDTSPKEIILVGSEALDYTMGTTTLGTAKGGTTVMLYKLNALTDYSYASVIGYMHVMHHEFSHILDQKKKMDPLFGQISQQYYLGDQWMDYKLLLPDASFLKAGFVTDYSTSDEDEDFAEIYSQYLVQTDAQWAETLRLAGEDGAEGANMILKKLKMVKEYMLENWNIDMDELRESVHLRGEKAASLNFKTFNEFSN